jgi:hypothetical protein
MNTEEPGHQSRWVRELNAGNPTPAERQVLVEVLMAMRRLRHGNVTLAVQDGKVIQLDVTERRRF